MPPSTKSILVNGVNLSVRDVGFGSPTLVFVHYWGGTGRTWDLVAAKLSRAYRCVAPDLRGWGGSDRPAGAGDYDLDVQANDIAALITSLDLQRYVLIGHSMGGKIAQILAARRPTGLLGLALVASAPPTPLAVPSEQRRAILESYQSPAGIDTALAILAEKPLSPELRQQVVDDSLGGSPLAKKAWTERGMSLDISGVVGSIDVPTTVIVGDADRAESVDALRRELASRIAGAQIVILPGVGHLSPLEAPNELAAEISKAVINLS